MLPFAVGWTFLLKLPQKLTDNTIFFAKIQNANTTLTFGCYTNQK